MKKEVIIFDIWKKTQKGDRFYKTNQSIRDEGNFYLKKKEMHTFAALCPLDTKIEEKTI